MEDQDLIQVLREKQSDGIVAILFENVEDLQHVEKKLKNKYEYKLYNPDPPTNSPPEVISNFLEELECQTKAERRGKR